MGVRAHHLLTHAILPECSDGTRTQAGPGVSGEQRHAAENTFLELRHAGTLPLLQHLLGMGLWAAPSWDALVQLVQAWKASKDGFALCYPVFSALASHSDLRGVSKTLDVLGALSVCEFVIHDS